MQMSALRAAIAPWPSALAFLGLYAVLAAPAIWQQPPAPVLLASLVLAVLLAALSAIDLRTLRLPDALTAPLALAGLLVAWLAHAPVWWHALSAVIGFVLPAGMGWAYRYLRGRQGLGLGDAKLIGASCAWLGVEGLPGLLLWASGSALVAVLLAAWRAGGLSSTTRIPFGPFLAFGAWIVWLYGPV